MRISDLSSDVCSSDLRLDGRTIDWARLDEQASDSAEGASWTCSTWNSERTVPQIFCAITRTNAQAHAIIAANLDRSPRSEGRRVGKECVSTCRSRWSPDH